MGEGLIMDSEIEDDSNSEQDQTSFEVHKLKVHYFFTEEKADLKDFFKETKLL